MRRRKIENQIERQLLIALIVSKEFLAQAAPVLEKELQGLRDLPLFHLIADWCLVYQTEYKDAPKAHIETIYHSWADQEQEEELADSVHDLLEDLSGEYETANDLNVKFLLDKLSEFLNKKKLTTLQDELDGLLSRGDSKTAEETVTAYRTVELGLSAGIDPLNDDKAWKRAFQDRAEPLVTFSGAAGRFFNAVLNRDSLIAVQAPEKRGKTWWLLEFFIRSLRNRKKVAVFEVGDLSESEIMLRTGVRLARLPLLKEFCGEIKIPNRIVRDDDEELGITVEHSVEKYPKPLTLKAVQEARKSFKRACGIPSDKPYSQFSIHPMGSINVKGISAILDKWQIEKGFIADVIIIDYADILAPENVRKDTRDMINETWMALKALAERRHALVITATQANAEAYKAKTQGMGNFSNDKRKNAHVNGIIGLNQTDDEKEAQVMRLNYTVLRGAPSNAKRCLYVGTCFALGRAMTTATL